MNWTPSNWGNDTSKPKGDSGWHIAASMTVENENEESFLLRDKGRREVGQCHLQVPHMQ